MDTRVEELELEKAMSNRESWRRLLLLLLVFTAVPMTATAQAPRETLRIIAVDSSRPQHVEFLLDLPRGTQATDPKEFRLLEDGTATTSASTVRPFRNSEWTLATAVAIDTSGSVKRVLNPVSTVLPGFVASLPPNDALAVLTFDNEVRVPAPFGTPREQVRTALSRLAPSGNRTLLYDAINTSLETLEAVPNRRARRQLVVISDGADESDAQAGATDRLIQRAITANVAIHTIWIGQPDATRNTLIRLAERTSGLHVDATVPADIAEDVRGALQAVMTRVDQAIVVAFDRAIEPSAMTQQVGVQLDRAGMAPVMMRMQMPRTAAAPVQRQWIRILATVALSLLGLYVIYAAVYKIVEKTAEAKLDLFPFVPWPFTRAIIIIDLEPPTRISPPPPPPRQDPRRTRVGDPAPIVGQGGPGQPLTLEAIDGPLRGQRIAVAQPRFQVGAGSSNDLRIPADKYLSKVHAVFQTSRTGWVVLDQGSSNGTLVDGRRISGGHELKDGERVKLGASEFRVILGAGSVAVASPGGPGSNNPFDPVR